MEIKADGSQAINDPIFSIVNSTGDTVFAVYEQGVKINVADDPAIKASGKRGGFAVGGFKQSKGTENEYLRVTPDSVRIYIADDPAIKASGKRGGFAVGGFKQSKGTVNDYLTVSPDSVRVYVTGDPTGKASGKRGGFAVAGFGQSKALNDSNLFYVSVDTTTVSNVLTASRKVIVSNDIYKPDGNFYIPDELATLYTNVVSNIGADTASAGGNVTIDGRANIIVRGICWSTSESPTIDDNTITSGSGTGEFTIKLTGLALNTTYYVRAFAVNSVGTAYGNEVTFSSAPTLPSVTTNLISDITAKTAVGGGNVDNDGGAEVTARGICWSTSANPTVDDSTTTDGNGTGVFISELTDLILDATYYVRAYATNSAGTAYGNQVQFISSATIPTLSTIAASNLIDTTAASGGNISDDGGLPIIARGVCWSTAKYPTIDDDTTINGTGIGVFTSSLTALSGNTTYYVRAYATNGAGTAYGNQVSFTTPAATETVTDIDGNIYTTVTIGTQTWMVENLKTTHYRDGTEIPNVTDNTAWNGLTTGAYCDYDNTPSNSTTYGKLYNWFAATDARNICPTGWHVPSNTEWYTLTDYLTNNGYGYQGSGNDIGKAMAATSGWFTDATAGNIGNDQASNNSSGYTALPGGFRNIFGPFGYISYSVYWWGSTDFDATDAWYTRLQYNISSVYGNSTVKKAGFSVRCIKDDVTTGSIPTITTDAVTTIATNTATSGGNITSNGGAAITARGVCWSTSSNPTITDSKTNDGNATGTYTSSLIGLVANTLYYVRAYATNSVGTAYGNEVSFTTTEATIFNPNLTYGSVSDNDGNTYKTITIGTQTWMAENLKTTKYRDGTSITNITDDYAWTLQTSGAYCYYNNDAATYKANYGSLYNWYAVVDNHNLCPTGWHIPSDVDWTSLVDFLGGGTVAGGKLKATTLWNSPNIGADNSSGFTALPGGSRSVNSGNNIGNTGSWWSNTEYNATNATLLCNLSYFNSGVSNDSYSKWIGFSVRCLQGEGVVLPAIATTAAIAITTTTATSGGTITSNGGVTITASGVCWSTSQNPTVALTTKTTDNATSGTFTSSITGLTAGTTYYVRAYATNSVGTAYGNETNFKTEFEYGNLVDIDGNNYKTLTIGTQTWMVENLKTTHYRDGTDIPNITDNTAWAGLTTGAYCDYANTPSNSTTYGKFYNWYAAVDAHNICPTGWHVPTDAEWSTLTDYLTNNGYGYQGSGIDIAKSMAAASGWTTYATAGTVGNDQGSNNSSGFTALPGGYRYYDGAFYHIGNYGYWWSANESITGYAWYRLMRHDGSNVYRGNNNDQYGFSVRCVKD